MKGEVDRTRISNIVVAIDLSEFSKEVMEKTFIIATAFSSDVHLVSVVKMSNFLSNILQTILSSFMVILCNAIQCIPTAYILGV